MHSHTAATVLTSSGLTGLWLVFRNSSIIFGSLRRSFLHPTRMIGRFWQKCRTSDIHYKAAIFGTNVSVLIRSSASSRHSPSPARCLMNQDCRQQSKWGWRASLDRIVVEVDRNLLDLQYPIEPALHAFRRPQHPQLQKEPRKTLLWNENKGKQLLTIVFEDCWNVDLDNAANNFSDLAPHTATHAHLRWKGRCVLTSGKVPRLKTINRQV